MRFYSEISQDERSDWRKSEATKLALVMLRERAVEHVSDAVSCLTGGDTEKAKLHAGQAKGINEAIDLLENDQ
jgi:hypothetical protein